MLMLLFYLGNDRYTIAGNRVVEVISLVELKKLARSPAYIAGLLNYRGKIIPVLNLCQLVANQAYQSHLSTRIIIVNYFGDHQTPYLLGLIAERVTETLELHQTDFVNPGIQLDEAAYLGDIVMDAQGMIQCIQVESLLSEQERKRLLLEGEPLT